MLLSRTATMAKTIWFLLVTLLFLFASAAAADTQIKVTNNPADKLVAELNNNRTAHKASALYDNPGLACLALQYIKAYEGDCKAVGGPNGKKPADSQFAETFAPNCGIQASTLSQITGRLLGCQSEYLHASEAFSQTLIRNSKSLDILYSKNHTEVGAAVSGTDGGSPYFWCVLFSSGKPNSTFVFEGGVPKLSKPGCFSGANDECSGAHDWSQPSLVWSFGATALIALGYVLGL
ncbi:Ferredoxin-like protein [Quillaja saponaria]|uniref:Ferredoxin-like protein n=1 Tax=Quillaja saponaria TaxID=32244 RepID=A0AAD7PK01_QUISA|nr:Ferredoxin-like protein [Quillaja saponaria]